MRLGMIGLGRMGGNMVATVGEIQNYPNSRNIIPDKVHFTVDIQIRRSFPKHAGRIPHFHR